MSQSSERLVFFVTPAQKRVLAARAERLGISLSELVRRAVLAFDETGEEVRAAGLVDRLGAARSQIAESDRLRRLAAGSGVAPGLTGRTLAPLQTADEASAAAAASRRSTPAEPATSGRDDEENENVAPSLSVAAAVARALATDACTRPDDRPDADDEAVVARAIANQSGDLSRF
ncbi:hypothetical protein [Trinickia soli]|uniref:Uncharacterized protein n=1 Tax=Trinickia soli TaxID=380675 RepID=A0A2N7WEM2_9BURK|nr:hypothetical protein [Trinickia soli]PMS27811.1 hypothetical protein C0Z19_03910 [Trinickia soli]CAB3656469.1 hypothetical protein LMG24076_01209 [Trinickia soli]